MSTILLYGANGFTGDLVARLAHARGHELIVAGRSAEPVTALASELDFEARVFRLDVPSTVDANLTDVSVVLNCAGPFSRTATPMVDACLRAGAHYLDVTGELDVFESVQRRHEEAMAAGVMLMPGTGFDVVPSDCLAVHLAARVADPHRLILAFRGGAGLSHGTATTMVENLHRGSWVRKGGRLVKIRPGSLTRKIDFGRGPVLTAAIPWGDLSTAYRSTGIPNIEVYTQVSHGALIGMRAAGFMPWLVGSRPVQGLLKRRIDAAPAGPSEAQRAKASSWLWGRVESPSGESAEARLRIPEGYTLTAEASLAIALRALEGDAPIGYQTPAQAYGADFVLSIDGAERTDL